MNSLPTVSEQSDRDRLVRFFLDLQYVLEYTVTQRGRWMSRRSARRTLAAWLEVRRSFADILGGLSPDRFGGTIREFIPSDEALEAVGLTGAQLRFKLALFNSAYTELRAMIRSEERPKKENRLWRLLKDKANRAGNWAIEQVTNLNRAVGTGLRVSKEAFGNGVRKVRANKGVRRFLKGVQQALDPANVILKSFTLAASVSLTGSGNPAAAAAVATASEGVGEFKDALGAAIKKFLGQ